MSDSVCLPTAKANPTYPARREPARRPGPARRTPTRRWPTCSTECRSGSGSTRTRVWTAGRPSGNCIRLQNGFDVERFDAVPMLFVTTDISYLYSFYCCSSQSRTSPAWSVVGVGFSPPAPGRPPSRGTPDRRSSSRLKTIIKSISIKLSRSNVFEQTFYHWVAKPGSILMNKNVGKQSEPGSKIHDTSEEWV